MRPGEARNRTRALKGTEGWLLADAAELFAAIDDAQKRADVRGNLFEIGVHHGKSAAILGAMLQAGERLGACDLFEEQQGNVSASGKGDRVIFEETMRRFGIDVTIHAKPSGELTTEEIDGPVRFFHVDGGHNADEAFADLELAAEVTGPGGVIVLDDPWSVIWPGVTEGAVHFLDSHDDWGPLLLGLNKFVMVRNDDRGMYLDGLLTNHLWNWLPPRVYAAQIKLIAGQETTIISIPSSRRLGHETAPALARALELRTRLRDRVRMTVGR